MTLRGPLILLLTAIALLGTSCLERTNPPLPGDPKLALLAGRWRDAGTLGGTAKLAHDDPDPLQRRYDPGTFLRLSGLYATDTEVWACDLKISRLQAFDFSGKLTRSFGRG